MWPSWLKKRASKRSTCPSTALVAAAATPSLKDILSLLRPEPAAEPPQPAGASSPRVFHRLRVAASALRLLRALQPAQVAAAEEEEGGPLVLYFTTLEAIPRTFQDCCAVRTILQGLRATVDERDLSIDGSFASELAELLPHRPKVTLPQLFVGGRHLGGAEEVRRLHESGALGRIVGPGSGPAADTCDRCRGLRFVLCGSCHGSHKQFTRKSTGVGGLFRDCADCTRNGLVRCPVCFPPAA